MAEMTAEQLKLASVGKMDQECQDCFGGTAISTDRCWHCGSKNIRYVSHQQQGIEEPETTQFLCGARRISPEQFAKVDAARWPKRD
jgi:DNA-directed RNA polymerase subunit M/transcription elongation factor TFIIS